eukprot:scaffold7328_cov314-Pinguiococcus_pyrenoidosus.AAC.6
MAAAQVGTRVGGRELHQSSRGNEQHQHLSCFATEATSDNDAHRQESEDAPSTVRKACHPKQGEAASSMLRQRPDPAEDNWSVENSQVRKSCKKSGSLNLRNAPKHVHGGIID